MYLLVLFIVPIYLLIRLNLIILLMFLDKQRQSSYIAIELLLFTKAWAHVYSSQGRQAAASRTP